MKLGCLRDRVQAVGLAYETGARHDSRVVDAHEPLGAPYLLKVHQLELKRGWDEG
jgi:hypothetical protein